MSLWTIKVIVGYYGLWLGSITTQDHSWQNTFNNLKMISSMTPAGWYRRDWWWGVSSPQQYWEKPETSLVMATTDQFSGPGGKKTQKKMWSTLQVFFSSFHLLQFVLSFLYLALWGCSTIFDHTQWLTLTCCVSPEGHCFTMSETLG